MKRTYPPLRAVIFDLDGTLVHSAPGLCVPYGYNEGRPVESLDSDAIVATILDAARIVIASREKLGVETPT